MKSYIDNLESLGCAMTQNLSISLILVSLRKEYEGFVQNYNMHSIGKTANELHVMLKLHEQTLPPKEVAPAIHAIRAGRIQKNQKKKSHKAAKGNQWKGKAKIGYVPVQALPFAPKPKNPPTPKKDNTAKDAICHQCGKGLRGIRKLKPRALSLYVGDGHRATVEAIGDFHFCLPRYPKEMMGYSFYYPPENKIFVARNAEFPKNSLINHEASGSLEDLEIIQDEDTYPSLDTSLNHEEDDQEIDEPQSDINPIRRSTRTCRPTDRLCLYVDAEEHALVDLGEPANYKATLLDPESYKWLNAINVEMQSMKDNEVRELNDLPPNRKTISHKWLFKKKTDMDGAVHTYKAHIRTIRILRAITTFYDYEIWQIDVKTAFLNGYLNEVVCMEQPEGFVSQKFPNRVCKLKHSIYGLKQASRQWNKHFDDEIKKFGFKQNQDEPCVYVKASGSYVTFLILFVDNILIIGNNIPMLPDVKYYLRRCFAMKDLGEAAYFLESRSTEIDQSD
ncbi:retrotransposon protein, putative, ty1-copia subclass [Tanacetum coccineum]